MNLRCVTKKTNVDLARYRGTAGHPKSLHYTVLDRCVYIVMVYFSGLGNNAEILSFLFFFAPPEGDIK